MDAATVAAIGTLPRNRGVLGALIKDQARSASAHLRRSSFVRIPQGHPPMTTFLGVSVRLHASVFGNLYLADRLDGAAFTAEDEELVESLAATAGIAIENARL
jgi:GAF domain-containing protein